MSNEVPPWLREQLTRFEQSQQNLQAILAQKQQVEMDLAEVEKALGELTRSLPDAVVYKSAGSLLVKTNRETVMKDLEEQRELGNTRITILAKQENKLKESLTEIRSKIEEAARNRTQQQ